MKRFVLDMYEEEELSKMSKTTMYEFTEKASEYLNSKDLVITRTFSDDSLAMDFECLENSIYSLILDLNINVRREIWEVFNTKTNPRYVYDNILTTLRIHELIDTPERQKALEKFKETNKIIAQTDYFSNNMYPSDRSIIRLNASSLSEFLKNVRLEDETNDKLVTNTSFSNNELFKISQMRSYKDISLYTVNRDCYMLRNPSNSEDLDNMNNLIICCYDETDNLDIRHFRIKYNAEIGKCLCGFEK